MFITMDVRRVQCVVVGKQWSNQDCFDFHSLKQTMSGNFHWSGKYTAITASAWGLTHPLHCWNLKGILTASATVPFNGYSRNAEEWKAVPAAQYWGLIETNIHRSKIHTHNVNRFYATKFVSWVVIQLYIKYIASCHTANCFEWGLLSCLLYISNIKFWTIWIRDAIQRWKLAPL